MSLLSARSNLGGGLGSYIRHVARALAARAPESFVFFASAATADAWRSALPDGAEVIACPTDSSNPTLRSLFEIRQLPRLARQAGCDVLFYPNTLSPLVQRPVPVVTVHDVMCLSQPNDFPWFKRAYLKATYWVLARSDVDVVTVSEFSRQDITRFAHIPLERITPILSGVDEAFFAPYPERSAVPGLPNGPYLLSVAAAYPHKRLPFLVEAFDRMAGRHPELSLVMVGTHVGSDEERANLAEAIAAARHGARVVRLAPIDWALIPTVFAGAVALTQASRFEGFGLPVAESMSVGVPVIAAPAGGVAEVLAGHGVVAADWSHDAFVDAVESILAWSPAERRDRARAARAFATETYRWSRVADDLIARFESAAARAR